MRRRRIARGLELAIALALAAAWAVTLRPTSLGGTATYVVVRGDSMLPDYHAGDLVILQANTGYSTGDAIGYRVPDGQVGAGHIVFHRIVGGNADEGFAVEGDNNPAPDPWKPRQADVAGRLWLLLPGAGRLITFVQQPAAAGALAVSLLVVLVLARRPPAMRRPTLQRTGGWGISTP